MKMKVLNSKFPLLQFSILFLFGCGVDSNALNSSSVDGIADSGEHRLFVTSVKFQGNLGGILGGDTKCQQVAEAAGLRRTYKAILSNSFSSAQERLMISGKIYIFNSNGDKIQLINLLDDLWLTKSKNLLHSPHFDENGQIILDNVWSGTLSTGLAGFDTCGNWLSSQDNQEAVVGNPNQINSDWLEETSFNKCSESYHLYCLSQ
jgi:hypothetical protein